MKYVSPVAPSAVFVFLYIAVVIPPWVTSQKLTPQEAANGQRIFNQWCTACHDTLGTATKSGPRLKNYYREHQPHPTDGQDLVAYLKTL